MIPLLVVAIARKVATRKSGLSTVDGETLGAEERDGDRGRLLLGSDHGGT